MNKTMEHQVQIISVSSTAEGNSTIKFGCSSDTLSELEKFVDKEKLLKFMIKGAEEAAMFGYIANVHSSYGGKTPRYFSVKLDATQKVNVGEILTLTGQQIDLIIEIPESDV